MKLGDYLLDQHFKAGWGIGLGKTGAIANETRKAIKEAAPPQTGSPQQ